MPLQLVSLTDSQADFIKTLLNSGRYANSSEVFRDGLRLLQHRESEVFNEFLTNQNSNNNENGNAALEFFTPPLAED